MAHITLVCDPLKVGRIIVSLVATNIVTGEQIVFDSILAARKAIGTCHVQEVLNGIRQQAKGYTFALEEAV